MAERRRLQHKLAGSLSSRLGTLTQIFSRGLASRSVERDDFGVRLAGQLSRVTIANAANHIDSAHSSCFHGSSLPSGNGC